MQKLPSLYGLRAMSVTIVILYHLVRFNLPVDPHILLNIPIFDGQLGVNVFFVISGFLITSLLAREEEQMGFISLKSFYARRTLRIFPAYYFLLLVYWLLELSGYLQIPHSAWLTALTYTKYVNYRADWYTAHAWSLSIEENFYLFWPILFMAGRRTRRNTSMFLIIVVPVIRYWLYFNPVSWINDLSFFTRIDAIAMGCYFALNKDNITKRLSLNWSKVFYISLAILFTMPWLEELAENSDFYVIFVCFGTLHGTIANILIAFIMMYSVFGPVNRWRAMLNSKLFNYVGLLSYSLYLWQQFYISENSAWITHFPQNIVFIYLSAMFSYYLIEKPFLRLKSRLSSNSKVGPESVAESRAEVF